MQDFNYKKSLGQNFLNDKNVLTRIVNCVPFKDNSLVIEVGPGETVDGKLEPVNVKKGDNVIVSKYSGTEVKYEGIEYIIVKQDDILAIVE